MSESAAEYRKAENERASHYYYMKKKNLAACASADDADQFCVDNDGSIQQQNDDTAKEKKLPEVTNFYIRKIRKICLSFHYFLCIEYNSKYIKIYFCFF